MTKTLDFSPDLKMPVNAVTQKLAFLGISGSGKTYGAGKFVEGLLDVGAQVVVIDTIGNWWGLRVAAGKDSADGYPIPVLGGEKGDVALEAHAGNLVADTVAESRTSMIVDVSDFTGGELRRFVTDFATRLLKRKKQHKSPTMVIWEECQDIVPQFVRGESAAMVGAVEKLIKKGRNYGVGTVLISQRPQAVNKDVLNQVETVFAFRTGGSQERKALESWMVNKAIDVEEVVDDLPSLPTGTCYVWSPEWLKVLKKVKVAKKWTFDASATPEFGDDVKSLTLKPVDLEKFKKTMAGAIEKAKANDPEELKKQVRMLMEQNKALQQFAATPAPAEVEIKVERVEVPGISDENAQAVLKAATLFEDYAKQISAFAKDMRDQFAKAVEASVSAVDYVDSFAAGLKKPKVVPKTFFLNETHQLPARPAKKAVRAVASNPTRNDFNSLGACSRAMLKALATRHPTALTRVQLATLSGYSHKSSGFANSLSQLNSGEWIVKNSDGTIGLSDWAARDLEDWVLEAPTAPDDLLNLWVTKLAGREGEMLMQIAKARDRGLTREQLADRVGLSVTSSGFANYLSKLNSNGLIRKEGHVVKADPLFIS